MEGRRDRSNLASASQSIKTCLPDVPSNSSVVGVVVVEVPQLSDLSVGCLTHRVWDRGSRPASIKMDCHGLPTRRVGSAAMAGFIGHPKISQGFSDYLWIRGGVLSVG